MDFIAIVFILPTRWVLKLQINIYSILFPRARCDQGLFYDDSIRACNYDDGYCNRKFYFKKYV